VSALTSPSPTPFARSTPLERLLRARLVYKQPSSSRVVSFEYLNRQLVWQELSDFLLFVLPLINVARIKRAMLRAFPRLPLLTAAAAAGAGAAGARQGWTVAAKEPPSGAAGGARDTACKQQRHGDAAAATMAAAAAAAAAVGKAVGGGGSGGSGQGAAEAAGDDLDEEFNPPGPCPICGLREIAVPYTALPCRHVFCYYCLRAHCEADAAFECPVDGERVAALQRFDGRRDAGG
jgi:hypothetical protein